MHSEILTSKQQELLPIIKKFSPKFGLVGGTAIALFLGHRRSVDFDLFSLKPFKILNIKRDLLKGTSIQHTIIQGESELTVLVNQVKLTFYHFPYAIDFVESFNDIVELPTLQTLGAMKAFALGKRAKWKDYVDLYFLIKKLGIGNIIENSRLLFGREFNEKLFRVQLGYFKDVDYSEEVEFMPGFELTPDNVKKFLTEQSLLS